MTNISPPPSRISIFLSSSGILEDLIELPIFNNFNLSRSVMTPAASMSFDLPTIRTDKHPFIDTNTYTQIMNGLQAGNMIKAMFGTKTVFTGYITKKSQKHSGENSKIFIECKDTIWRLQQCRLNHLRPGLNGTLPLEKIVKWALDGLMEFDNKGLPLQFPDNDFFGEQIRSTGEYTINYNQSENLKITGKTSDADINTDFEATKERDVKPQPNEFIYSFLTRLIKPFGYILQADYNGNLMFYRPNNEEAARFFFSSYSNDPIESMIQEAEITADISETYSHYYVFSNSTFAQIPTKVTMWDTDKKEWNTTQDKPPPVTVRRNYFKYKNPKYPPNATVSVLVHYDDKMKNNEQCEKLAKRKCSFDLARYWQYSFSAVGLQYPPDPGMVENVMFSNDIVVDIQDYENFVNEELYVLEVEYSENDSQQVTRFVCAYKEAMVLS